MVYHGYFLNLMVKFFGSSVKILDFNSTQVKPTWNKFHVNFWRASITKIINQIAPSISELEQTLPRKTRRTLSQLRTGKSPFLIQYKNKIDSLNNPSNLCSLCKLAEHDTGHLFNCPQIPTNLTVNSLWNNPVVVSDLLEAWSLRLGVGNTA